MKPQLPMNFMCCILMLYGIYYFILVEAAFMLMPDIFRARISRLLKLHLANVVNLADEWTNQWTQHWFMTPLVKYQKISPHSFKNKTFIIKWQIFVTLQEYWLCQRRIMILAALCCFSRCSAHRCLIVELLFNKHVVVNLQLTVGRW